MLTGGKESYLTRPSPARDATLFPYTTLFRSQRSPEGRLDHRDRQRQYRQRRQAQARVTDQGSLSITSSASSRCGAAERSEEHTSELQSPYDLVCRLLLEKKNGYTRA